jgi:threonine dehydrogenase-like Zn-dependent dehydrogenase
MADVKVTDTIWKTNVGDERGSTTLSFGATAVAPEPSTFAVFGLGMIGLLALQLFKRSVFA